MLDVPDRVKEDAGQSIRINWNTVGSSNNNIEKGG